MCGCAQAVFLPLGVLYRMNAAHQLLWRLGECRLTKKVVPVILVIRTKECLMEEEYREL